MNPFELPGPQFLPFFWAMCVILLATVVWVRRAWEPDSEGTVKLTDPYEIACLRDGPNEAIRLATTGLIDRGLLWVDGEKLKVTNRHIADTMGDPLERAILKHFHDANDVKSLFASASVQAEVAVLEKLLEERGLRADKAALGRQVLICLSAIGVIWITANTKIEMAKVRGYPYMYLLLSAVVFTVATFPLSFSRRTHRGKRFLKDMRTLFTPLRLRAATFSARSNTNEALMLAAVFGVSALPVGPYPYVKELFAKADSSGSGSSCGSSGSSCGSSCGGGGCGGGCGGCGS